MEETDDITVELNGINYVKVNKLINGHTNVKNLEKRIEKNSVIVLGVKEIKQGGILRSGYCIFEFLVPVNNVLKFQA